MPTIRNRFFPFHDISSHNKVSLYSLNGTGLAGTLVKIDTGSANPQTNAVDGYGPSAMGGVTYNGTFSNQYENNWKVSPTASGDTRYAAIGFTEYSTLIQDENGFILRYNDQRAKEIKAVASGVTIPIITDGMIGLWGQYIDTSMGPVQPGSLAVVSRSGNGLVAAVAPGNAATFRQTVFNTGSTSFIYGPEHVIGKFLSSLPTSTNTGLANEFAAQGGYAFLTFDLSA